MIWCAPARPCQPCRRRARHKTTALLLAARGGHRGCVGLLLDARAPADAADAEGVAADGGGGSGRRGRRRHSSRARASAAAHDGEGATALLRAARAGNLAVVDRLVGSGEIEATEYTAGRTALAAAAAAGHAAVVGVLLKHGATARRDDKGDAPLALACRGRHLNLVRMLLDVKVTTSVASHEGSRALGELWLQAPSPSPLSRRGRHGIGVMRSQRQCAPPPTRRRAGGGAAAAQWPADPLVEFQRAARERGMAALAPPRTAAESDPCGAF